MDSRIGESVLNTKRLQPRQLKPKGQTDRKRQARNNPETARDYNTHYHNAPPEQHWQTNDEMGLASEAYNSNCQPPGLNLKSRRDQFMSNGPLSQLRRRSAAYLEDAPGSPTGTDQGLLSRIKAHLTGTGPGRSFQGLGGMFTSGHKYSRLSEYEPEWDHTANKNINAGPQNRKKRKKKKASIRNEFERLPAPNQTANFVNETIVPERSSTLTEHSQQSVLGMHGQGGFNSQSTSITNFIDTYGPDVLNMESNHPPSVYEYMETTHTHRDYCDGEPTQVLQNEHSVLSVSNISPRDVHTSRQPSKRVCFDVNPGEKEKEARRSSIIVRCATPHPSHRPSQLQMSSDLSEYDLIPTSLRPRRRLLEENKVKSNTDSPSSCVVPSSDLDNEVADIISGSSNLASSISVIQSDVHIPGPDSKSSQYYSNLVPCEASVSNTAAGLHVGMSPAIVKSPLCSSSLRDSTCKDSLLIDGVTQPIIYERSLSSGDTAYQLVLSPNRQASAHRLEQSPHNTSGSPKNSGQRSHIRSCKRRSLSKSVSPLTPTGELKHQSLIVASDTADMNPAHVIAEPAPCALSDVSLSSTRSSMTPPQADNGSSAQVVSIPTKGQCLTDMSGTPERIEKSRHSWKGSPNISTTVDRVTQPNCNMFCTTVTPSGQRVKEEEQQVIMKTTEDMENTWSQSQTGDKNASVSENQGHNESACRKSLVSPFY